MHTQRFFIIYTDKNQEKRKECLSHIAVERILISLASKRKEAKVYNEYGEVCGRVEKESDLYWKWWIFCV